MKTHILLGIAVMLGLVFFADTGFSQEQRVTSLRARFGGGCTSSNTTGSCTIKVRATGSELNTVEVGLLKSDSNGRNFHSYGRTRMLSDTGDASWRFRNDPTVGVCYRVRDYTTGGRSNTICIK